jgi:hypothetical protein
MTEIATGFYVPATVVGDPTAIETLIEAEADIDTAEIVGIPNASPSGADAINHGRAAWFVTSDEVADDAAATAMSDMATAVGLEIMPGTEVTVTTQ